MQYSLNILVQGFCPLKIKIITQFPGGFCLDTYRHLFCFKKTTLLIANVFNRDTNRGHWGAPI